MQIRDVAAAVAFVSVSAVELAALAVGVVVGFVEVIKALAVADLMRIDYCWIKVKTKFGDDDGGGDGDDAVMRMTLLLMN